MITVPVDEPDLSGNEEAYVLDAVTSGWISTDPYVTLFQEGFAAFIGTRHAVTTTSGTAALRLAMAVFGLPAKRRRLADAVPSAELGGLRARLGLFQDHDVAPSLVPVKVTSQSRDCAKAHISANNPTGAI